MKNFIVLCIMLAGAPLLSQTDSCLILDIETKSVTKGGEICIAVRVKNFVNMQSLQFSIGYDPTVVSLERVQNVYNNLVNLDPGLIRNDTLKKALIFLWDDINAKGQSVPDGVTLFELCFKAVGKPGECTSLFLSNFPASIEAIQKQGSNDVEICVSQEDPTRVIKIQVPSDMCALVDVCGSSNNTGIISLSSWGGTAPYIVEFSGPPMRKDTIKVAGDPLKYTNLPSGNYTLRVTDVNGLDTIINVTVPIAPTIVITNDTVSFNQTRNPTCWNTQDGRIGVRVSGGVGPLLVGWKPVNIYGVTTIRNLGIGNYTLCVQDSLGCTVTQDFTLQKDSIKVDLVVENDESCRLNDGAVSVRASGGDPFPGTGNRYNFSWDKNTSANCAMDTACRNSALPAGRQFVIVEDKLKCKSIVWFDIVSAANSFMDSVNVVDVSCFGGNDGSFQAYATSRSGLKLPINFTLYDNLTDTLIPGGNANLADYTSPNLKAGTYRLELRDSSNCTIYDTIKVLEPPPLQIQDVSIDLEVSCVPGNDGYLSVNGVGGTAGYKYFWDYNSNTNNSLSALPPGTYNVTVSDANLCTATKSYRITMPMMPVITGFNNTDVSCPNAKDGCVEVLYTNGSVPVNLFNWSPTGFTSRICNLGTGIYSVTITDSNGCTDTASTRLISTSAGIILDSVTIRPPTCPGSKDGVIIVFPSGGQTPYNYNWSNGARSQVNSNLGAGNYILFLEDNGPCPAIIDTFMITDPAHINIQVSGTSDPSCFEQQTCDGRAIVNATGIHPNYTVVWSSGEKSFSNVDTAHMLCAGDQYVIVSNGQCSDTLDFKMNAPPEIKLDATKVSIVPPSCYGYSDGTATIGATGGVGSLTYVWADSRRGPTVNGLREGSYYFTVIDQNGCMHVDSVRLRQPDSIRVDVIAGASKDISCYGAKDGKIVTIWNGGNGGNGSFQWIPNVGIDSILTDLAGGTYRLIVTDKNNCTGEVSYSIKEPSEIQGVYPQIDEPKCEGDKVDFTVLQAFGGSGSNFRFTINGGAPHPLADLVGLDPGTYSIRVYDANNCFTDTTIVVPDPVNALSVNFTKDQETIQLGDSVRLDGQVNSSSLLDTIIWTPVTYVKDPQSSISFVDPSVTTKYILTVIDENGCLASDEVLVIVENRREFFAPNVISPNDDGVNDGFTIYTGTGVTKVEYVEIFDRWGNQVYYIENPDISSGTANLWNGEVHGQKVNPGVFAYVAGVKFKDGFKIVYRGDLTIVR
ncbi:MAG TPA: gliding motility-associated C-terminal domain-containing protein [Saprospiraceae bacterium]|nr:gliding motility-associated C-terminal domain-containing protein [Saprospiraceae bacterium]